MHTHIQRDQGGGCWVCVPCRGGKGQSSLSLARATCPALVCLGPFAREPVIFLFVERQQGSRIEKDSKSHLIMHNIRSFIFYEYFKKAYIFS